MKVTDLIWAWGCVHLALRKSIFNLNFLHINVNWVTCVDIINIRCRRKFASVRSCKVILVMSSPYFGSFLYWFYNCRNSSRGVWEIKLPVFDSNEFFVLDCLSEFEMRAFACTFVDLSFPGVVLLLPKVALGGSTKFRGSKRIFFLRRQMHFLHLGSDNLLG